MRDGCIHRLDFFSFETDCSDLFTFEVLKTDDHAYVANESPLCEVILQYVMTSLYACHLIGYGQDVR